VRAPLDDAMIIDHQDLVGVADGAQPVGDDQAGAVCHKRTQALLDKQLGARIHRAGGLVQDEDARVLEDGPSDGQKLAVAVAEHGASFAHFCLVPLWQALDEGLGVGQLGRLDHLRVGGI